MGRRHDRRCSIVHMGTTFRVVNIQGPPTLVLYRQLRTDVDGEDRENRVIRGLERLVSRKRKGPGGPLSCLLAEREGLTRRFAPRPSGALRASKSAAPICRTRLFDREFETLVR